MAEETIDATLAFIDLAGFTALTETHGDRQAADLAEQFHGFARDGLAPGDRLVKSIGDAVMLSSPEPSAALGLVDRVLTRCLETSNFPITRTGLHHGRVVRRGDDMFGAAVNLAARVAAHAAGGQVLATEKVAAAARALGFGTADLGKHRFRNIMEPVRVFEVHIHAQGEDRVIDPVCRMSISPASAAGRLTYADTDWWFCSLECAGRFSSEPESYQPGTG